MDHAKGFVMTQEQRVEQFVTKWVAYLDGLTCDVAAWRNDMTGDLLRLLRGQTPEKS